ncbi:MAG: LapA family protein [Gordonia sp. (in: high G+C Gram-positive bacteria)]|uniref:LapA family protein n=1 Tax=Gordonia sp. (in: high G+C Gram-positive bacteria) TaxID=84139 RepID=UPI003BB7E769
MTNDIPASAAPAQTGPARPANAAVTFLKRFWLPIVLVILAIIFIVTNTEDATFNIGWVRITQPLWLLLTITLLVGLVIGWFVGRRGRNDK